MLLPIGAVMRRLRDQRGDVPSTRVSDLFEQLSRVAGTAPSEPFASAPVPATLDARTRALVVIAAAICSDATGPALRALVTSARSAGATEDDILGVLFAVAPAAGESRLVAATPRVSKALGYDIAKAFERG